MYDPGQNELKIFAYLNSGFYQTEFATFGNMSYIGVVAVWIVQVGRREKGREGLWAGTRTWPSKSGKLDFCTCSLYHWRKSAWHQQVTNVEYWDFAVSFLPQERPFPLISSFVSLACLYIGLHSLHLCLLDAKLVLRSKETLVTFIRQFGLYLTSLIAISILRGYKQETEDGSACRSLRSSL